MSIRYQSDDALVWQGDSLELMRSLPDGCVDSVVTDPPYNLAFMGKKWDNIDGSFQHWCEQWAIECLRLLKPGGYLVAFGGTRTWHRLASGVEDAGFELRDSIAWMHGQGFPKSKALLKPAFEPIVLARKPGPLQHLNIDACRIGHDEKSKAWVAKWSGHQGHPGSKVFGSGIGTRFGGSSEGRWPANVVLDPSAAAELDEMTGDLKGATVVNRNNNPLADKQAQVYGKFKKHTTEDFSYGDSGGASRFFYVAKASSKERPKVDGVSAHPTVKPLKLMRWLVRLVTPVGGTVLDPFAGSGTTVEACLLEGLRCMGMEREDDYVPLILHRVERATK